MISIVPFARISLGYLRLETAAVSQGDRRSLPARDPAGISRGLGCGRPRGRALYAPERRRGGVFLDR